MSVATILLWLSSSAFASELVLYRGQPTTLSALGDIHGDYDRMVRLLRMAGIIGSDHAWSAGNSVLIVTGDLIDKGPRPLDVLRFLARLRKTAPRSGGDSARGQSRSEFLAGPDAKKASDFLKDLRHAGTDRKT